MPNSCESAKRHLVTLLRSLGMQYQVQVAVTRESPPCDIARAYRSVARKVHPDKPGGCTSDFQKLSAAHDTWNDLRKANRPVGRPPQKARPHQKARSARAISSKSEPHSVAVPASSPVPEQRDGFRVRARAVLLTYQGFAAGASEATRLWREFLKFVKQNKKDWGVHHWTATLETNRDGKHHFHLMLDFFQPIDRTARFFAFEDRCPNAAPNDLLGDGWSRSKQWRTSVDRGHFYVWANKKGTVRDSDGKLCVAANYEPAWTESKDTYSVKAEWPGKALACLQDGRWCLLQRVSLPV